MSLQLQRGTVLGKYELLVRIGRGGMATVWVARGRPRSGQPERLVAVKAMLPELARNMEFRSMFLDEGQIARSIDHPNVVQVYDVGEEQGVLYMAMEWVEGDSLHAIIAEANKRRPIPSELAVRMIADTASGLHAAHELRGWDGELRGLVHCDISPHNILIGLNGFVKLVDFGVASAMGRVTEDDDLKIRGKFGYMSPEQAQAKTLDRRSDVFSLGIVLFELTTGYRLFRGRDDRHTLDLVTWGKIPRPSQVISGYPPRLESIVNRALERELDNRFQTADELRDALETYLVEERMLVPSAGVKGLVRRVLGPRLDQRRQAIRAALRATDGSQPGAGALVSDDPVLVDGDVVSVSVSQVEPPPDSLSSPSGLGAARLPSDSSASSPATLSQPGQPPGRSIKGFVIGAGFGVCIAAGAFLVLRPQGTDPAAEEASSAGRSKSPEASPASAASASEPSEPRGISLAELEQAEKLGFSLESLPRATGDSVTRVEAPQGKAQKDELSREERIARHIEALKAEPQKSRPVEGEKIVLAETPEKTAPPPPPAPTASKTGPGGLDMNAAAAQLERAASMVGLCRRPGGTTGPGKATVVIAPNGSVQSVNVQGKYAGTPVGSCVASQFQRVKVPAFTGQPVALGKKFNVPD